MLRSCPSGSRANRQIMNWITEGAEKLSEAGYDYDSAVEQINDMIDSGHDREEIDEWIESEGGE